MILVNKKFKDEKMTKYRLIMKRVAKACNDQLVCDDDQPKVKLSFALDSKKEWFSDEGVPSSWIDYVWMAIVEIELGLKKIEKFCQ